MKIKAFAKINLTLEITGNILDGGFHELKSVMHKTPLYDELEIIPENSSRVSLSCNKELCAEKDNLAFRAADAYLIAAKNSGKLPSDTGVKMHLSKYIPDGAGLGGGSSDAAAVLRALDSLFGSLDKNALFEIANSLGSDIAFCLSDLDCAYCTGRGEILTRLSPLPSCFMLIAKPSQSLSTKGIYTEYDRLYKPSAQREFSTDKMIDALKSGILSDICGFISNDFEELCQKRLSEISSIKETMLSYGALASCMSGSGSAVYGLFDRLSFAKDCQKALDERGNFTFLGSC